MNPGDILITLRTCGDLRRGDVVTVSHTSPSGEYVYLDETDGKLSFWADAFMVAVRRPWHAWADPEWERRAREAAERFVREGLVVEATAARDVVDALERGLILPRDLTLECTRCRRTMPGDRFRDHDCAPGGAAPAHSWAAFLDGPDGIWGLCDLSEWGRGNLHARTKDCVRWHPALSSPAKETSR